MKRIWTWMIAMLMVLSIIPAAAQAAEVVAEGTCGAEGDNLTWVLTDDGVLTISGEGAMSDYNLGTSPWNEYRDSIASLNIGENISSIGSYAFYSCALTDVVIPGNVETVGAMAFQSCTGLQTLKTEFGVCALGEYAFSRCDALVDVVLSGSIETFGDYLFSECTALESVMLQEGITQIGNSMFRGCSSLHTVNFPGTITEIGYSAFSYCTGLVELDIPDSVTTIGSSAFSYCTFLERVKLPANLTNIASSLFYNADALREIDIPPSVTSIGEEAFCDCDMLKSLTIPEGVTSIGVRAFRGCYQLEYISIPGSAVDMGYYAFYGCEPWHILYGGSKVQWEDTAVLNQAYSGSAVIHYGAEGDEIIPSDKDDCFLDAIYDCTVCGDTLKYEIWGNDHVYEDGFCIHCGLQEGLICVVSEGTLTVTDYMGSAAEVVIPTQAGDYAVTAIGEGAFRDCDTLQNVTLADGLISIGEDAFYSCENLTEIIVPDSVMDIGEFAFAYCGALKTVRLPEGLTVIRRGLLRNCFSLQSIEIPETVTSIEGLSFEYCTSLTSVVIPEGVTSVLDLAFTFCENMHTLVIPATLTVTDYTSIAYNFSLSHILYTGTEQQWNEADISLPYIDDPYLVTYNYTEGMEYHVYDDAFDSKCNICGQSRTVQLESIYRVYGENRYATSLMLADELKIYLGVETFDNIIIASGRNYPDALTGSYLAALKNAPILLTENTFEFEILALEYAIANLSNEGTVYILGGESAVSANVDDMLSQYGIQFKRLAGENRFGTNLEILKEAGVNTTQEVLICTAIGFADSLSASAAGLPILLVHGSLTSEQKSFLAGTSKKFVIIGGESAVPAAIENELKAMGEVTRLGGASRYQTSVMVAERFVQNPDAVVLAYARNYPDGLCGGPLAIALNAPLILTDNYDPSAADAYVSGISAGIVVGGAGLISDESTREIFDLAANAPINTR